MFFPEYAGKKESGYRPFPLIRHFVTDEGRYAPDLQAEKKLP